LAATSELARVPGFERLDSNELVQLEALTQKKRYPANTAIFFQDDPADALYILLSGTAKAFQTSEDGKDRIVRVLKPGHAFGELAMIAEKPRLLTVQTLSDCEMLRLPKKEFTEFAEKHTWVLWTLLRAFANRIAEMNSDILEMSYRDVPYRLLRAISDFAAKHGEPGAGGATRITTPMREEDLAALIGADLRTVSRLLEQYETEGIITRTKAEWTVPDADGLRRTLEYMIQQGV
jgi:CRP/FNR family cyclic AMP-dependent transcriptional regulator